MAQFDVYENPNQETKQAIPYLLDVQVDLLDSLGTRVIVPLAATSCMEKPLRHLNPQFKVRRATVVMSTAELAGVPVRALGQKVGTLKEMRNEIVAALDFLFMGF